jgi:hypothetical protein
MSTHTPLQSIKLTSSAASVTFTNIDQTYADLYLVISCLASSTTTNYVNLQFNGDTGTNYSSTVMAGTGSSPISNRWSNRSNLTIDYYATPSNTEWGMRRVDILQYSNSTVYKTIMSRADRGGGGVDAHTGTWRNFLPITSITINLDSDTFAAGSTFSLYGISPVNARVAQASGGTSIAYDSSYVYHVFTGTGTFTPNLAITADVLVIAGGGGAGTNAGGGGGAGGVTYNGSQSLTAGTSYVCTVGSGGTYGDSGASPYHGTSGVNSTFVGGAISFSATGGGYGANLAANGANGGSGGGGGSGYGGSGGTGGSNTSGQGNIGSAGNSNPGSVLANLGGGAGGGAGAAGGSPSNGVGGAGGNGTSAYSSWFLATGLGQNVSSTYYIAGGGGGGAYTTGGAGGYGGGGAGSVNAITGGNGLMNSGSGGGGGSNNGSVTSFGGAGGSGVIIVRYAR